MIPFQSLLVLIFISGVSFDAVVMAKLTVILATGKHVMSFFCY